MTDGDHFLRAPYNALTKSLKSVLVSISVSSLPFSHQILVKRVQNAHLKPTIFL